LDDPPIFVRQVKIGVAADFSDSDMNRASNWAHASSRSSVNLIVSALAALPVSS
jgi:hypothetical protein